jgi:uncharacterized RDD family membrane protein YckC
MKTLRCANDASITEISSGVYADSDGQQLTAKQVRQIVTPHDFNVASELVGQPLARPWRRGLAMLLDAILIVMLASGSLIVMLPVAAYLAWRCHKLAHNRRRNTILLLLPLLFIILPFQAQFDPDDSSTRVSSAILLGASAIKLSSGDCDQACATQISDSLVDELNTASLSDEEAQTTLKQLLADSDLPRQVQQDKLAQLQQQRAQLPPTAAAETASTAPEPGWWQRLRQSDNSLINFIQGILSDLGISFGWAVVYFTLFVSWNNGQTPGKSVLGIRIVQLDNKPLSLWGAFGRQGGYSAGIATGLLGFLQIYWDPNRQAVQDKLANTLVLRLKK